MTTAEQIEYIKNKVEYIKAKTKELETREKIVMSNEQLSKDIQNALQELNSFVKSQPNTKLQSLMSSLISDIQQMQKNTNDIAEKRDKQFIDSMQAVIELIEEQAIKRTDEIPANIYYTRNPDGKITQVREAYDKYTLIQTWNYDSRGNLTSIQIVKNVKTS